MAFDFIMNNIPLFIFVAFIVIFCLARKENLEIQGKYPQFFILMYKTKLGLDKMGKWSKKYPKTYLNLAYLAYFVGVAGLVFSFLLMFYQIWFVYDNNITSEAAGLVLPVNIETQTAVPIFAVPFSYWLIALFVLVVVHEFAHGVIAKRFGIPVKSSGFAFFGSAYLVLFFTLLIFSLDGGLGSIFSLSSIPTIMIAIFFMLIPFMPAAFVEPDDKVMAKKKPWQQIAVLGAGSTSNFLFGFLFLAIWIFFYPTFLASYDFSSVETVSFTSVMNESDLVDYGIENGTISKINGEKVSDLEFGFYHSLTGVITPLPNWNLSPNETIVVTILENSLETDYNVQTFDNGFGGGFIGISGVSVDANPNRVYLEIERTLYWLWLLNIGIGIMNLLPLWITDGGQVLRVFASQHVKKKENVYKIVNFFSLITLLLLILLLFPNLIYTLFGWFGL